MRLHAPAKINLYLRAGKPRADGFHPLVSWMCTIGLFDDLEIERAEDGAIQFECDHPQLAADASNLAMKAATLLREAAEAAGAQRWRRCRMRLEKHIPLGAGLGGGSSDAATVLMALNRLWELNWPKERLSELAARLGSDVPFFLHAPSAICRGRGEEVRPIAVPAAKWAAVILPQRQLSTAAVYRRFDELGLGQLNAGQGEPDFEQWVNRSANSLLPLLLNDLEAAAFALDPQVGELRANLEQMLGRIVRMSGSGSSLFSLFDHEAEAKEAAEAVEQRSGVRAIAAMLGPAAK